MIKLGRFLHISSSRNLIVRAEVTPPLGATVLADNSRKIGRIVDIFGPKRAPYVSVKSPLSEEFFKDLVGKAVFYSEEGGETARHRSRGTRSGFSKVERGGSRIEQ